MFRKALLAVVIILVGGVMILGGVFVRRPWSRVDGEVALPGLSAPVDIIRDEWGVPHIYAQNEHDLFFAQGYAHAQDRLWQMEMNRRTGAGTLSEILGEATLDADRFLRTMGLRRAAENDWALVDDDTRAILEAYSEGVNAYVETHRDRLPLEFTLLGVDPEPWTPVDTLAWGKVMCYDLGGNYEMELWRARVIANLGEDAAAELFPAYSDGAPVIIPSEARSFAWLRGASYDGLDSVAAVLGDPGPDWGSNSWAVHGSRTATGKPLLANDPHLGLNMPSVWYENGLHGGRFDSVGFTFPGVPMVIIGHNDRIAWGATNLPADVQDFYIERVNDPVHPTRYKYRDEWRDLEVISEVIEVKGGEPETLEVLLSHHGPIMNDVIGDLERAEPLALHWTALEGTRLWRAVVLINLARDWDQFRQALSYWDVPSQNFVYADVEGNIGYQSPGRIPIRAPGHRGLVPVPGWTGEYEWQGFIPFDELPSVLNPAPGFIATANNKVVPDDYPYHLAYEWSAPYRAQRIVELLAADASVTIEDIRDIQAQTYSLPAQELLPYLLAVRPENDLEERALAEVADWDLYSEADRAGAAIYQVWYWFLIHNTLGDELGEDVIQNAPMMVGLMAQRDSPWFDDRETMPPLENRDAVAQRSFADAVAWLSENLGGAPADWEWGRLHTMTFIHQPLGQSGIRPLEWLFNSRTIPARGDGFTVDAAAYEFEEPYALTHGVSQRMIVDLNDLDNSRTIHTTGQSGQLFHRHREDFISMWQEVEYHPMLFGREAVEANAEGTLTLTPR